VAPAGGAHAPTAAGARARRRLPRRHACRAAQALLLLLSRAAGGLGAAATSGATPSALRAPVPHRAALLPAWLPCPTWLTCLVPLQACFEAFVECNRRAHHQFPAGGTTATLAVAAGWELLVANVGDSCAFLDTGTEASAAAPPPPPQRAPLPQRAPGALCLPSRCAWPHLLARPGIACWPECLRRHARTLRAHAAR
jgi:hypothetical protein